MKQAKPGDPVQISAKEWNDVRLATQMVLSGQIGADKRPGQRWTDQQLSIRVKNTTGSNVDRFDVLAIDDMVFNLEDNKEGTIGLPCLKLRDIKGSEDRGNVVVVQAPIKVPTSTVPGIDKGVMSGVTAAYVDVKDENDKYIDVGDASRAFVSAGSGGVGRIIWKPAGTGRSLCMVLINGSGGSPSQQIIQFRFGDLEYPEEVPEACEDREPASYSDFIATVERVACGADQEIYGADEDGNVQLTDPLGLLDGRDYRDLVGRTGIAALMRKATEEYEYQEACEWVVVYIDFHREEQFLHDWVVGNNRITVERARAKVWDFCLLEKEIIEGTKCEDDYYTDGGGV